MAILVSEVRVRTVLKQQLHNVGAAEAGSVVHGGGLEPPVHVSPVLQEILHLRKGEGSLQLGRGDPEVGCVL